MIYNFFSQGVSGKTLRIKIRLEDASIANLLEEYLNEGILPIPQS
ncbi:hypothetical protein MSP8887_03507 [Marinomonas spartinae]|nr:hypothetical protein [Marinomonas spartinae]SBS38818.1 hypothetical protein MSP8887_03507 [Marinomonas spartinae]